jgi:hypothetical protein
MDERHEEDCGCQGTTSFRAVVPDVGSGRRIGRRGVPAWLPKIVMSKSYASDRDIIVSVFMRGGADGLSLVVPYADANYYTSRSTIAIPRPDATAATKASPDGFFMFPQAMAGLMPAFQGNDLLVVHDRTAEHLVRTSTRSAYMEVGKPVDPALVTGWLGRHLASIPPLNPTAPCAPRCRERTSENARWRAEDAADRRSDELHRGRRATQTQRLAFMQTDYAAGRNR